MFDTGPVEMAAPTLLTTALARLEQVELVGVTDDLPALIARAAAFWQQPNPPPVHRVRVSSERPAREDLPDALLDIIRDGTTVDAALYERASGHGGRNDSAT